VTEKGHGRNKMGKEQNLKKTRAEQVRKTDIIFLNLSQRARKNNKTAKKTFITYFVAGTQTRISCCLSLSHCNPLLQPLFPVERGF
jgi:hypothetical protein